MATNNAYRVVYHFEKNGKRVSDTSVDVVVASDQTQIASVLSSNSKTNNGIGSPVIETYSHIGGSFLS